jgi:F-type H+-transporting ATPase subunit epsilon
MAGTFKFELVTPERMALSQDATQVLVPGMEGEFTVLPGHAPVISALRPGVIEVVEPDATRTRIYVKGGFAEVDADRLTVLAERALDVAAMGPDLIARELESAEADLAAAADDASRLAAASAVERLRTLAG